MRWFDRIGVKKGVIGIEVLRANGFAIAAKGCFGKANDIDLIHILSGAEDDSVSALGLSNFVQKQNISKRICHLILSASDYQLLLVEAPDVPDQDMREAVRWRVKDLISFPVEQAIIDVFAAPRNANRAAKKMVYVVVSEKARMQSLISLVNNSGLRLASIDVGEMAMRNLSLALCESRLDRGLAIVRILEGGGSISLYKDGNLYLSRQFQLDYKAGLLDDLPADALALEVQRSLDYYERQMGLSPPAQLFFCGENISDDKITEDLKRSITVPSKFLDMREENILGGELDEGMMQMCLGAVGATYREAVAS